MLFHYETFAFSNETTNCSAMQALVVRAIQKSCMLIPGWTRPFIKGFPYTPSNGSFPYAYTVDNPSFLQAYRYDGDSVLLYNDNKCTSNPLTAKLVSVKPDSRAPLYCYTTPYLSNFSMIREFDSVEERPSQSGSYHAGAIMLMTITALLVS